MRPKDAASLILVRRADAGPRVLMGRREPRHAFMPDVFVFPGGAVDRGDGYAASSSELRAEVLEALVRDCTAHRARAIALAGGVLALAGPAPLRPLAAVPFLTLAALLPFRADERYGLIVVDGALLAGGLLAAVAP